MKGRKEKEEDRREFRGEERSDNDRERNERSGTSVFFTQTLIQIKFKTIKNFKQI